MANRFRFTKLHAYAGHVDRRYSVTRTTDGQVLGTVHRRYYGAGSPSWEIECDNNEWNGCAYDSQAEAADALDAANLVGERCACGESVAAHDRATRIAMRAYANSTAEPWTKRQVQTVKAFRNAIPRNFRYSLKDATNAGYHAQEYAQPHTGGDVKMVQTIEGHCYRVNLHIGRADSSVRAVYSYNGLHVNTDVIGEYLPDPVATVAEQIPNFEALGYVRAYDWSR